MRNQGIHTYMTPWSQNTHTQYYTQYEWMLCMHNTIIAHTEVLKHGYIHTQPHPMQAYSQLFYDTCWIMKAWERAWNEAITYYITCTYKLFQSDLLRNYIHTHTHTCTLYTHQHMHARMHTNTCAHTRMHAHTHIHTCMHTHTNAHREI